MNEPQTHIYEFGEFRADAAKRLLSRHDGVTVPLKPKVFETLLYLIQNNGKILDKDELMSAIWTDTIVEENNLSQNISILRRVFGEKHGENRFIATIPGHGYKFVAEVREISDAETQKREDAAKSEPSAAADGINAVQSEVSNLKSQIPFFVTNNESQTSNQTQEPKTEDRSTPDKKESRFWLAAMVIASLAGLSFLGFYSWRGNGKFAGAPIKTVAVLPFKPLILENRNEALELGMADTLINKISSSEEIIVRPLGSVRRYNNLEQDVLQAGRELGVDSVLEGTIQTAGDRIRIAARLVRTNDGKQLWTETFDEKFTDIFVVQDSISQKVLTALTLKLSRHTQAQLTKHNTENIEAYQLYMKGRFHAWRLILPEARKGVEYYNQAIALDPNYALAYVGLAQTYVAFSLSGDVPANDAMPKAKAAALKAIELDPNLPESQVAVGLIAFWYDWNWTEAEKKYQCALELDPNNAAAHYYSAHLNSNLGQHEKALTFGRRARELDPLSVFINSVEGQFLFFAGHLDEAVSRLNKTLELDPNFWHTHLTLSGVYTEQQKFAEAVAEAEQAARISGGNSTAVASKGYALAKSGNLSEARKVLAELQKLSAEKYVPAYNFAVIYNALGETETALDYLEKAFAEKNVLMVFLKVDPKWNNLRSEPRFIELMRRMNFQ